MTKPNPSREEPYVVTGEKSVATLDRVLFNRDYNDYRVEPHPEGTLYVVQKYTSARSWDLAMRILVKRRFFGLCEAVVASIEQHKGRKP